MRRNLNFSGKRKRERRGEESYPLFSLGNQLLGVEFVLLQCFL